VGMDVCLFLVLCVSQVEVLPSVCVCVCVSVI